MSNILFPAMVENSIAKKERDATPARERQNRKQSKAMVVGLVQSLQRLVNKLSIDIQHTDWSQYDQTHTYKEDDFEAKNSFVDRNLAQSNYHSIWDIGCNTGTYSRIAARHCNFVVALDGDHDAVEKLYLSERSSGGSKILPLVMNITNLSPGQGWEGRERLPFDKRRQPDAVLCLALIHHIRISANVPNALFLQWLRSLEADIILEFVDRHDEMVIKLLTNKSEQYSDYNLDQFTSEVEKLFAISDRLPLKGGKRILFFLKPR